MKWRVRKPSSFVVHFPPSTYYHPGQEFEATEEEIEPQRWKVELVQERRGPGRPRKVTTRDIPEPPRTTEM